jgi:hypothetical protein
MWAKLCSARALTSCCSAGCSMGLKSRQRTCVSGGGGGGPGGGGRRSGWLGDARRHEAGSVTHSLSPCSIRGYIPCCFTYNWEWLGFHRARITPT